MKEQLHYGTGPTVAGPALVVWSPRGIRNLRLLENSTLTKELADLRRGQRELKEDSAGAKKLLKRVSDVVLGKTASVPAIDPEGTPFQQRVWQTMVKLPRGKTLSYQQLAAKVNKPLAVRAVASCCARNPICLLVPCHRIVRSDGKLGGYYYGLERKQMLLELEGVAV